MTVALTGVPCVIPLALSYFALVKNTPQRHNKNTTTEHTSSSLSGSPQPLSRGRIPFPRPRGFDVARIGVPKHEVFATDTAALNETRMGRKGRDASEASHSTLITID